MSAPTRERAPAVAPARPPLRHRDPDDPDRRAAELAQRGRLILDVAAADLEVAEAALGPFHETTWHFRNALAEARRSWDRLRAEFGSPALEAALEQPPLTTIALAGGRVVLVPIGGKTYRVERVAGTDLAPIQWRLVRFPPPHDDGPYFACRLRDGATQCDCAEWTYQIDGLVERALCKHLAALAALGWM